MKNDPCVRLGMRMSPKMREKPADRRKSRPPSVMLFTASTNQRLTLGDLSGSALERRIVSGVDGLREEPLLLVRPELAHVLVGLDGGVHELVALPLDAPDVEAPDDVAEVVELERTARRVGQRYGPQRLDEGLAIVRFAAGLFQRRLGDHPVDVESGGVGPGNVAVLAHHSLDELLVARRVDVVRVEVARDHADRFVAERFQERVVAGWRATENR